jgi:hypothetical protein
MTTVGSDSSQHRVRSRSPRLNVHSEAKPTVNA